MVAVGAVVVRGGRPDADSALSRSGVLVPRPDFSTRLTFPAEPQFTTGPGLSDGPFLQADAFPSRAPTVAVNGVVTVAGAGGAQATLDILRIEDPERSAFPELVAAPGNRLVSFRVRMRNTGTVVLDTAVEPFARVSAEGGRTYPMDPRMTAALQAFPPAPLAPTWEAERVVVFEVNATARLTALRITVPVSGPDPTALWTL